MTDLLLNPVARRLVGGLRLPLPLPARLRREGGAWQERSLSGRITVIGASPNAQCLAAVAAGLAPAGAVPYLAVPDALRAEYRIPEAKRPLVIAAESDGASGTARAREVERTRSAPPLEALGLVARIDALVFDATGLSEVTELRALFDFFQPLLSRLDLCARAIVIARPPTGDAVTGAVHAAVEGFVRSLAKEIGRRGGTANLVRVDAGAEGRIGPVLRFLLSGRASFVTGQPLFVSELTRAPATLPLTAPLRDKVALVTGAARGIGEATARLLAREGAHVLCVDHPQSGAGVTALSRTLGGTALLADITDTTAPERITEVLGALGGVDVIVHNAGITRDKTLARMSASAWDSVLAVNLAAVLRLQSALDSSLREGGRVILLSSVAGIAGNVGQTAYATSKAGLLGFARGLAGDLASRGITVNAVAPGFIETRLTQAMPFAVREAARRLSALAQGGLPEDVAELIVFLASPGSHGISGATVRVCGGALVGA